MKMEIMKKTVLLVSSFSLICSAGIVFASEQKPLKKIEWDFEGVLGHVDKQAAQRGFQVYKEVCSACHGLSRIAFRNLSDLGFSQAEVKALSSTYQIHDGPNDQGEMFDRAGKASDYFVPPHANEQAARAAHNGAYPPDLSLIVKARHEGADYIYSLLTGYGATPPADMQLADGQYYNPYFPGGKLAMPQPLADNQVTYSDGTPATLDQEARDVVTFLQWAAEPEMEARKQTGVKALLFLAVFSLFLYLAKRNIWRKIH